VIYKKRFDRSLRYDQCQPAGRRPDCRERLAMSSDTPRQSIALAPRCPLCETPINATVRYRREALAAYLAWYTFLWFLLGAAVGAAVVALIAAFTDFL
jgi:hypothetical protein